jgi:hypothetical protein
MNYGVLIGNLVKMGPDFLRWLETLVNRLNAHGIAIAGVCILIALLAVAAANLLLYLVRKWRTYSGDQLVTFIRFDESRYLWDTDREVLRSRSL